MLKKFNLLVIIAFVFSLASCGSSLYSLKSSNVEKKLGQEIRLPYASVAKYYGYISNEVKPQGKYKGKNAYYLYMWVPAVIDEVGVSMYSPADGKPGKDDFKHPLYENGMKAKPAAFFDTYLALDRMLILDSKKIIKGKKAKIFKLGTNDDSSEIPANPKGRKYNSLLRVKTNTKNISKALIRSVYRITFTSFRGSVEGSFLVQVGTNVPGVKIAASLEELDKIVNAPAPAK
jgi:putative surface lipoprotein